MNKPSRNASGIICSLSRIKLPLERSLNIINII